MDFDKEMWVNSPVFPQKYEISNYGRLKNKKTNHIYKLTNKKGWYFTVVLKNIDGQKKTERIHRLVAKAFIPNLENKPQVNHIDGNKQNNHYSNLEWVTQSENMKHAVKINPNMIKKMNEYNDNKIIRKYGYIYQLTKDGKIIGKFKNTQVANKKTGVCARNILHCIKNEEGRKTAGGYIWKSEVMLNADNENFR